MITRRRLTAGPEASSTTVGDDGIVRHGLFQEDVVTVDDANAF